MALYDYSANQEEELSIRKNEKLTLMDSSKTWWRVKNSSGATGYVPSNYCKKIDAPASVPKPAAVGGNVGIAMNKASNARSKPKEEVGMYQQVDMTFNKGRPMKTVAIVKYPYAATRDDELSLSRGEHVNILEKEGDGWWNGECGGRSGWFPSNYVEETQIPDTSAPEESTPAPSQAGPPAQPTVICRVRALYAFQSGNQEELSFERGNVMDIIDRPENDPDWWEARKADGSTGLVPRNYVEVVHDEPSPTQPQPQPSQAAAGGRGPAKPSGKSFEALPWFHGKMSRQQCESLLTRGRDGDFLVRESESKVRNGTVLAFCILLLALWPCPHNVVSLQSDSL